MDNVEHFPLLVAKLEHDNGNRHQVTSPYDDQVIATIATAGRIEVDQALTTASQLFEDRQNWLPISERISILQRAIDIMRAQFDELVAGAVLEGGKPLIDTRVEMTRCIDSLQSCVDVLRNPEQPGVTMGINPASSHRLTTVKKEPIGVVVAISAFNHPLNLIAHQVGPAIASGCPVIVKPADDTPLSCYRLVNIFHQAGLPLAWCQALVTEDHHVAEQLATDPRVAFLSFIGSAKVGWHLRSRIAAGTRCALEHGGVAPVVVTEDADIDKAIPALAKGAFYHAGQVCVSVQRIYAHESIARKLCQRLAEYAAQLVVGDPLAEQTEIGPLIRHGEITRVGSWVQEAVDMGAELVCGGHALPHNCYAPTIIYNPSSTAKISSQEIFGPVVAVYPYQQLDDAISAANALDYAFQASIYSQNIDSAMYVSDRLAASAVMINEHTAFRVDWMPFAGLRHSGLGVGGISHTMADMQVEKMIVITSPGIQ